MTPPPIPLVDLAWQQAIVADEVEAGWRAVVAATAFVQGPAVADFEEAFAAFVDLPHCVGVANGTDAIELALRALRIGPGRTVVVPANTFIASASAVLRAGAAIAVADVDPDALLLDPEQVPAAAEVVLPVHLFGQLAPMEHIIERAPDATIVEDAAQAQGATRHGRPIGHWGAAASTSFYPGKNLGAYGDGGAVVTADAALAETVRMIGNHGSRTQYRHEILGFNSRLDTLQAVVLSAKLSRLADWNQRRRDAARRYDEALGDLDAVQRLTTLPGNEHVWHLYPIRVPDRDRVLEALRRAGIGAGIHYPVPLHLQPSLAFLGHGRGDFPVAEAAADTMISLPMHPGLDAGQQERVVDALRAAL